MDVLQGREQMRPYAGSFADPAVASPQGRVSRVLRFAIFLFLASGIFDPGDQIAGLKAPLFCFCWAVFGLSNMRATVRRRVPLKLIAYVCAMILIPSFSIMYYFLTDGRQPFQGFLLLKAYLLISFAVLLYLAKLDLVNLLSAQLTLLALLIIAVWVLLMLDPGLFLPIYDFGVTSGILRLDNRRYAEDFTMRSVFFITSPMLVLPIAHYVHRATGLAKEARLWNGLLAAVNILAMFLAGTRNNMFTAILLPLAIISLNLRYKILIRALVTIGVVALTVYCGDALRTFLNPDEISNRVKLELLADYGRIFSAPMVLWLGQGLGAYCYWGAIGREFFISELTYLEVIRNFGLVLGGVIISLMVYPVLAGFPAARRFQQRHIIVGYAFYLAACISNPLFFSSMGVLLLSVVLANLFLYGGREKRPLRGVPLVPLNSPAFVTCRLPQPPSISAQLGRRRC